MVASEGPASPLTADEVLHHARGRLAGSRTARLDAEVLLGHVLGRERAWVIAHPDACLSSAELAQFRQLIERRASGEPVAYLRGWLEWYGMPLQVCPGVLIPRPETELLLERAVSLARTMGAVDLADIGTGSGALAIGLARELPEARVAATDVSPQALEIAAGNSRRLGVSDRISFRLGSLSQPLDAQPELLVANLPYLSTEMMRTLDRDVRHEPADALFGGPTGLELYDKLRVEFARRGWSPLVLLEIDPRQTALVKERWSDVSLTIEQDYAGHDRIVMLGELS